MNKPTLGAFCDTRIGRADIEGSKSNVAMNAWLPQASYPCGRVLHGPARRARPSPVERREAGCSFGTASRRKESDGRYHSCARAEPLGFAQDIRFGWVRLYLGRPACCARPGTRPHLVCEPCPPSPPAWRGGSQGLGCGLPIGASECAFTGVFPTRFPPSVGPGRLVASALGRPRNLVSVAELPGRRPVPDSPAVSVVPEGHGELH